MTRSITVRRFIAGTVAVILMSSVLIGSAMEIMGARLALAGTSDSWPNGACERTYIYDHELNMDRPEMVCWTNDWSLSVPEPRVP